MGPPMDLGGYGEERLNKLEVADLRSECGRRGIDVKPQAQKTTCIKLLLDWKTAQAAATGLPFDLVNYGKERLEKLDVAALRTECALRGIDVKEKAQTSTCVSELLKWKAARGGAPAPAAKRKPKAEASEKKKKAKETAPAPPATAPRQELSGGANEREREQRERIFGPNPGPELFCQQWVARIHVQDPGPDNSIVEKLRDRMFDTDSDDSDLETLPPGFQEGRVVYSYKKEGTSPLLRSSPQAAMAASKSFIRRFIETEHDALGFDNEAQAQNIKEENYNVGASIENVIERSKAPRGSLAATGICCFFWKRSWIDDDGCACHARVAVSNIIMRVVS